MSLTWKVAVDSLPAGHSAWPARVSVPLPQDAATQDGFHVVDPAGEFLPAQSRTLTKWPDGSPRWVQLDFQARSAGEHVVHPVAAAGGPHKPVVTSQEEQRFEIGVGQLKATIEPESPSPLRSLKWRDRELIQQDWQFKVVDANGGVLPLDAAARNVTIEANAPHRFQLSWETSHIDAGETMLDVRFRLEFLAGVEGFSLSYQFFHKKPNCAVQRLREITADFPLAVDGPAVIVQQCHSNLGMRRFVRTSRPVMMHVDNSRFFAHVKDGADLDDDFEYPPFMRDSNLHTGSAVALESEDVAVLFSMVDMEMLRPKTLTTAPGRITAGIWPEGAGTLELPQGRSARQVFTFLFTEPDPERVEMALTQPAALRMEPVTVWLDRDDSRHAGASWDQTRLLDENAPGAALFSYVLHTATTRWDTVTRMFDYGDNPDAGYTTAYPSQGRTPGERDYCFGTNSVLHGMFHHASDLPPVWSNNEYDPIYCVALEALRTRDAAALRKLHASARHQIEVDFVHYSDHWQQHRATPQHSYDHVTLMSAIPSHQWTQGLYYYYALTGDPDVVEVVRGICEFNIAYVENEELGFAMFFNRELGWALVALVFAYEMTADPRYLHYSEKIIRKLEADANRTEFGELEKRCSTSPGLNATGIGGGFNVNTIPLGLKCFHQATGERWAFDILRDWVSYGMTNFNDKSSGVKLTELFPETFCYVCEITGDDRWIEESQWQVRMFFFGINNLGWLDSVGGPLDTKRYSRIYRGLAPLLASMSKVGLLEPFERQLTGEAGHSL